MTRIKICGLTNGADAGHAAACGAYLLGLVLAESPRRADVAQAARWLPAIRGEFPAVLVVGVFVRPSAAEVAEAVERLGLDLVQVHGLDHAAEFAAPFSARFAAKPAADPGASLASPRPLVFACGPESLAGAAAARPWAVLADRVGKSGAGGTGISLDWASLAAGLPAELRRAQESEESSSSTSAAGVPGPSPGAGIEAENLPPRLFLAGGLDAGNVAEAIRLVRPWAVDASSRLEITPGRKDPAKVAAFCEAVRAADGETRRVT